MKIRTYIYIVIACIASLSPSIASAHATPVSMTPGSGEQLSVAPEGVRVRFSERLEESSSKMRVEDSAGAQIQSADAIVEADDRTLFVPVSQGGEGGYIVTWSVVSQDDGHFTRGSFGYAVGSSTPALAAQAQVVQIAGMPEIVAMFVEFLGNSVLWGVLVVLCLILRSQRLEHGQLYTRLVALGAFLAIAGALGQIVIKSAELAQLHEIAFEGALYMYVSTAAGSAAVYRMLAIALCCAAAVALRRRVALSTSALFSGLIVFAFFRAIVSHATANPFYPALSVAVNFFHLIEKDSWLGVLIVVIILCTTEHKDMRALFSRASAFLALNFAALSLSASYIIWLHLKSGSNLTSSSWGEALVKLACAALALIILRSYHVFAAKRNATFFLRYLPTTLSAEALAAGVVVFFSAAIIVTSPPLHIHSKVFSWSDSAHVRLERSPSGSGDVLLTLDPYADPTVMIGSDERAIAAPLSKRFPGGYVFPLALIRGDTQVTVITRTEGAYDARATFSLRPEDLAASEGRGLDAFALTMLFLALCGSLYAMLLLRMRGDAPPDIRVFSRTSLILGAFIGALVLLAFTNMATSILGNDFKKLCLADGNMWHVMQPMRAGVVVSDEAGEGCMLSSGLYHFTDAREYEYLRALPPAEVLLDAGEPIAGKPAKLRISIKEADGSPAALSIEHERLLHVIVVSADMKDFSHIHPDDEAGYSDSAARNADFTVTHTFSRAGEYIIAIDYMHGLVHESRRLPLKVTGSPMQGQLTRYDLGYRDAGYDVQLRLIPPLSGDISTLQFTIKKDGEFATDLAPYLGAAMHVAIVKDDLSQFIHAHGEVHPPGTPPPSSVSHQHAPPPSRFGPVIESHLAFPEPGLYWIFGEFKHGKRVVTGRFTVRVE